MNQPKEQLETLLSDYVDGNLAGDELKAVESYLDSNPGVRDAVNRLMIDSEAIRSLPRLTAPFDFSEDVRGQLERDLLLDDANSGYPRRRRISSLFATIAAMLMLFLGIGGVAYWVLANRPAPFLDIATNTPSLGESSSKEEPPVGAPSRAAGNDALHESGPSLSAVGEGSLPAEAVARRSDEPGTLLPATVAAPKSELTSGEFVVRSDSNPQLMARRSLVTTPVKTDLSELIEDAPRFNDRAVVMEIDADHATLANRAVQTFLELNRVHAVTLAYDATRNRAFLPIQVSKPEAVADSRAQELPGSQVSGVLTNVRPDPVGQAMSAADNGAQISAGLPEPQVVLASGLTSEQALELQDLLQSTLGKSQALAYEFERSVAGAHSDQDLNVVAQGKLSGVDANAEQKIKDVAAKSGSRSPPTSQPALLSVGDRIQFTLIDPDASNLKTQHEVVIDAAGTIQLPMLNSVKASDMTLAALRQSIIDQYVTRKLIRQPTVDLQLKPLSAPQAADSATIEGADRQLGGGGNRDKALNDSVEKLVGDDLIDVYVVVRGQAVLSPPPTTQPHEEAQPTTQPH